MPSADDFLFRDDLAQLDPAVDHLIDLEKERQARKLIMIPSESTSPEAVREALGSVLGHIYAEGYPNPETRWLNEEEILNYPHHLAYYRRYGDRRYYRGVEYVDVIESLARRRCADAFETSAILADQIYVNVQPLSGAPANLAVQQALLRPGDTIMGLSLAHGGHLTHGSRINISGRLYDVVTYTVDERTELLDYDQIEELALEHRPKLIIAGYTSYPRQPNWVKFRQIADRVGAYLLADIAHVAGMVIAGAYPTPLPYADVVTFTTHKTLCGPRGACILTTSPELARKIDRAVFPGVQGGPHANKFAAMAVAFRLATTEPFRSLQHQITANARALAAALTGHGLRVPCGGTDTHLLLLDCTTVEGRDGTPLMGDTTAIILDLIGVVVNKNSIPGDKLGDHPSGIRLGTPWVTQRGLREPEMEQIASVIARAMDAIEPFAYQYVGGPAYRGKIAFDVLEELRLEVADLADKAGIDFEVPCTGYPHHCLVPEWREREEQTGYIEVEGNEAASFVEKITPTDVDDLGEGEWRHVPLLDRKGELIGPAYVQRPGFGHNRYRLIVPADRAQRVTAWLRHLSDGYVLFDDRDLKAKLPGPVVVRDLGAADHVVAEQGLDLDEDPFSTSPSHKPYFIGLSAEGYDEPGGEPLPTFDWSPYEEDESEEDLRRTALYDWHVEHGARMAPFAGWEMPLWYTSIGDEHRAVRGAAGLFDTSHMGVLDVRGPHAAYFLNLVTTNDVTALRPVDFGPGEAEPGESQYTFFLDPEGHVIDDSIIYRLSPSRYMVVVNAANAEKDWAWLQAVNNREVQIDRKRPWAQASFQADLRNLHDPDESYAWLVDVALQGPRSRDVLCALIDAAPASSATAELRRRLLMLKRTELVEAHIPSDRVPGGVYDLIIARTGYTGESMAFEIFVHPDVVEPLWRQLLEVGAPFGLRPVGLGARDSLRIEAGLPLYGHELAGPLDLRPDDAGFQGFVKLHKPFFVGRRPAIDHADERRMEVVRFRVEERGVRVPKQGDAVTDTHGRVIGQVTSCAQDTEGFLVGLAILDRRYTDPGTELGVFPRPSRGAWEKPYEKLEVGDRVTLHLEAEVIRRFMR
ncbi:MAG: serine hydroxymethyltransferase [Chloroflexota bacterium]|nr:serine hydroxymethyltransferase [Chloroflexota bacterium]